jgi:hypothetical protein
LNHEIKILLYIIIGIAYLFSRMYKKELKKQNEKKINKRPISSKTAEDIFRDLRNTLNLPSEESIKPVNQTVKERKVDDKLSRAQKIFISASESKMKHYKPIQASKLKKKDDAETFHHQTIVEVEYGPKIDFEPRKAMIFSEILKKPQY